MQYVCDAGEATWFRIETVAEAALESMAMKHAVEKYFCQEHDKATKSHVPPRSARVFEQKIGLKDHVRRSMPMFLTLRDREGKALVTAMLPPEGMDEFAFRPIIVGPANSDPYAVHGAAIAILASHFGYKLNAARCYPYGRV